MKKEEIKKFKEFRKWFDRYILKNYGKKCPDFTWNCVVCHAHFVKEVFGDFVEDLIATENWVKKQKAKPKVNNRDKKYKLISSTKN